MPRIHTYEQQVSTPSGEYQGRMATGQDFLRTNMFTDLGAVGKNLQEVGNVGEQINRSKDAAENRAFAHADRMYQFEVRDETADAQVQMSNATETWLTRQDELHKTDTPGNPSFLKLNGEMNDYFSQLQGNYKTQEARKYVQLHANQLRNSLVENSKRYHASVVATDLTNKRTQLQEADEKIAMSAPDAVTPLIMKVESEFEQGLGIWAKTGNEQHDLALEAKKNSYINGIAVAASEGVKNNPVLRAKLVGATVSQTYAPPNPNSVINSVLEREGSGLVLNDNEQGASRYGITQKNNPSVNVTNLTKEGAAQVLKENYWDKYKIDSLPANVVPVVFDGVVNHGSAFAQKLVEAAKNGASPDQLIAMRKAEYERLATTNPAKYGKDLKGWMNRLDSVAKEVPPAVVEMKKDIPQAEKPAFWDHLTYEQQVNWTRDAKALQDREQNIAAKAQEVKLKDEYAIMEQTLEVPSNAIPLDQIVIEADRLKMSAMRSAVKEIKPLMNASVQEQQTALEKLKPTVGTPGQYDAQADVYDKMVKLVDNANKKRKEDQMAFAYSSSFSKDSPIKVIEMKGAAEMAAEISTRIPQAKAVSKQYGLPERILMDGEAKNLKANFDKMDLNQKNEFISTMATKLGSDKESFTRFFKEISQGNPTINFIGGAALKDKSASQNGVTRDVLINTMLIGERERSSGQEDEKGLSKNKNLPDSHEAIAIISPELKGSSYEVISELNKIIEPVLNYYVGSLMKDKGIADWRLSGANAPVGNRDELIKAFKAVIGNPVDFGGRKVISPWGMEESAFKDKANALMKEVLLTDDTKGYQLRHITSSAANEYEIVNPATNMTVGTINLDNEPVSGQGVKMPEIKTEADMPWYQKPTMKGDNGEIYANAGIPMESVKSAAKSVAGTVNAATEVLAGTAEEALNMAKSAVSEDIKSRRKKLGLNKDKSK